MKKEVFRNPENVAELGEAQAPFWFWNDRLEEGEIGSQLELMTEKGITCAAPHARGGFEGGYLDEEWMAHIRQVVDYKRAHGETMWFYDEFNWPSGGANGEVTKEEDYREKYLTLNRFYVPANTRFRLRPESLRKMKNDGTDLITSVKKVRIDNLFAYDALTMEPLDIESFQPDDNSGYLFNLSEYDFEICRDRATIVFEAKIGTELFGKEGYYDPDYLNEEATKRFVDVTYEAYYREFPDAFGKVITAAFDDETRFCHAFPWTDTLLDRFEKQYGYCLEERLPDLILPGVEAGRIRCDYFNLIADLFRDNYHGVIRKWCEEHGIDYCPHLLGEETMAGQVRYAGELLRQYREMTRPGVDHLGKGIGSLNARFASSAAEVYGKKGLICEVFAGTGWDLTYEEYLRMISWLYSQGVKTITNHGFFYSIRDFRSNDWPPSQFFQWKGWEHMKEANGMCRRFYGMTKDADMDTDVLIYHPVETFWLHYVADMNFTHGYHLGPFIQDERAAFLDREEQVLLGGLQEKNRNFTVFPADAYDLFEAKDGRLVNKETGQSYGAFVLPMCEVLPLEVAELLQEFVSQGGSLAVMETVPSYSMKRDDDARLQEIMETVMKASVTSFYEGVSPEWLLAWLQEVSPQPLRIVKGVGDCKKSFSHYPEWIIDPYIHTGEDMCGVTWTKFQGEETSYYFVNYTDEVQEIEAEVVSGMKPEIWDPLTGEITPAEVVDVNTREGWLRVRMSLPKSYGIFLVTDRKSEE